MSLLRISVLSISGLSLWLAPPFIFSRRIPLHNFMQGIALVSGFACCFEARRDALKQAKAEELEAMKERAIEADVVDELAVSSYVAEQERRTEAELLLATDANRELLERALALGSEDEKRENVQLAQNAQNERAERVLELKAKGWGKAKIILEVWGINKGGSQKYKDAETEYHHIVDGEDKE